MERRYVLLAIAAIISLPVLVASFGASQVSGILIGAVLVLVGVVAWVVEGRGDDGPPSEQQND